MAVLGGRAFGVSSFPSSSYLSWNSRVKASTHSMELIITKLPVSRICIACSAVQESSASTATAETKAAEAAKTKEVKAAETKTTPKAAAPKAKPAKAPTKPLPEMMEEDVIPPLKAILEAQKDMSEIELSFRDNKLEGSFVQNGIPYSFWAFFPGGVLTGPKGFSLSSHGSGASTVEPFLIDEKKITARHVVFWVEKRLAAQGIIPVWKQ